MPVGSPAHTAAATRRSAAGQRLVERRAPAQPGVERLGQQLGIAKGVADAPHGLAWIKGDLTGDWPQAITYVEEARGLYHSLENRAMEADCLCLLANAGLYLGQPREATDAARAAQAITSRSKPVGTGAQRLSAE